MLNHAKTLWTRFFRGRRPVPRTGKTTGQAHRRAFFEGLEERVNPAPGDLDLTFGGGDGKVTTAIGISAEAYSVAVDSVGNYVVAGYSHNGLNNDFALARYTSAGALDATFGGGDGIVTSPIGTADDFAYNVAVDSAGNYVVAGNFYNGINNDIALVRYTSAGVLDTTFGGGDGKVTSPIGTGDDYGLSVAVDASGRYIVAGHYFVVGGNKIALVRFTSTGVLDTTFGGGDGIVTTSIGPNTDQAYGVAVDSAGNYLISGLASNGSNSDFALARYTILGVLDTTFGGGDGIVTTPIGSSNDQGYRMTVDSAGRYVVAGSTNNGSNNDFALTRYTPAGILDTTFGGGDGIVTTPIGAAGDAGLSVAEDSAGNYVLVGFSYNGANNDIALMRFTSSGVLDAAFGGGDGIVTTPIGTSDDYGWSVAVDSAGSYVVAGYSSNGLNNFALARYEGGPYGTLSGTLSGGDLTVTDTASAGKNNGLTLSRSGSDLVLTDSVEQFVSAPVGGTLSNGNRTLTIPLSSVTGSVTFNTTGGNDTLTIDLAGGDVIPLGNITFNGGNPTTAPGDKLVITGGNQGTVTYNYTNASDGNIVMSNFGTVNYTGLEPITNSGSATDIIFNLPAGPSTVTLGDDGTSGNGLSRLSSTPTAFELTDFANPTGSITINRGNASDSITVNALPDFNASLTIGSVGNSFASLAFAGAVSLSASKTLSGFASGTITVTGALTTSAGGVTLNAGNGITLSNALATGGGAVNLSADSDGNGTGGLTVSAAVMGVWTQQQQITATGGAAGDNFGAPVALSSDGNTAIFGDYYDDVGANADQGTALLFTRSAGVWIQQAQLTATGGAANDQFGNSVALSSDGNTAIVGAWADDFGGNTNQGTATVFTRSAGVWTQQAQLSSPTGANFDEFGSSVALSSDGNTAIIGARSEDFGFNTNQGKATVFTRSAGVWTLQQQLTATDGAAFDNFGISVAISSDGNTAIVGVQTDDVGGNFNQGSAAVFTRSAGVWIQQAQLTAIGGDVNDEFGVSVAISSDGNTAIVGAYADNVGANSDQGTATVFTRSAGVWTQQQQLTATGGAGGDWFGGSVALSSNGNMAIVGATFDNSQGTATVFTRSTGVWTQQQQLSATGGANGDNFGIRVGFSSAGDTAIVGAFLDDVGANTNQGSAYAFTQSGGSPGGSIVAGAGTVSISTADADIQGVITSTNTITITTAQSGRPIDLGTNTAGALGLTDAELDLVTTTTLQIGDNNSGTITVSANISRSAATAVNLTGGGAINFTGGQLSSAGGNLALDAGTSIGVAKTGTDIATSGGTLSFSSGDDLSIVVNGATVDTQYGQLNADANIVLTGLDLVLSGAYTPTASDSFIIVNNSGSGTTTGTFNGLPEGTTVNVNGVLKRITYVGGTGNDVVLNVVPETSVDSVSGNMVVTDVNGGTSADTLTISRSGANIRVTDPANLLTATSAATTAGAIQVNANTIDFPVAAITGAQGIVVNTLAGNDNLTINYGGGNLGVNVSYDGGNPTGGSGDSLVITGGSQGVVTYNYTNAHDGSIVMSSLGTVTYVGLEPITNTGTATDVIFNLPLTLNLVTLGDDGTPGNGLSRLSGGTIELTNFANPSNSVTVNRGNVGDTMIVSALPDFNAALTIGSAANRFSSVTIAGAVTLASNKNLAAFADSPITVSGAVTTVGGGITLSANNGITLNAPIVTGGGLVGLIADNDDDGVGTLTVAAATIAGWTQQAKLIAADGAGSDNFASALTVSSDGSTAVFTSLLDDNGANSNQGSAYVFTRAGDVWTQQAKLEAADGAANDNFGSAVAISDDGNTIVVGVSNDAIGANTRQGSAYVFVRSGVSWSQQAKLVAADGATDDFFGNSVSMSGDGNTVLVGAQGDDVGAVSAQGSAYVFTRAGAIWSEQAKLLSADSINSDWFGTSVDLSSDGNLALVGAEFGDAGAAGDVGAAYVFTRSGVVWTQQAKLTASDGALNDQFGFEVALSADGATAIIGANGDNVGANTDQGSAYIFTRSGSVWTQQAKLVAADGTATDFFGVVAISGNGNTAVVGAGNDTVTAAAQGSAYVFQRSGSVWTQQQKLVAGDAAGFDRFGGPALSADGQFVLVSSTLDDVGANANQGSTYYFRLGTGTPGGSVTAGAGAVSIIAADANLLGPISSSDTVSLESFHAGHAINLGTDVPGSLGLTDAELDRVTAGTLTIGNAVVGSVTVSADITRPVATTMNIASGAAINFTGGQINSAGGNVTLDVGTVIGVTKSGADITATVGILAFNSGDDLSIVIGGPIVDTQYGQLNANANIVLTGLDLMLSGAYVPTATDSFIIVNNRGAGTTTGTFNGLPEGAALTNFLGSGRTASITYLANIDGGGVGNDVVILVDSTLIVTAMTPTASGVQVRLNKPLNTGVLNLSDANNLLGPTDVTLVGAISGNIRGSLVLDNDGRGFTFMKSGGPLAADSYTLTLRSAANGMSTPTSELLDGNNDGTTGDNYVQSFVVGAANPNTVTVAVDDFIRGYGQAVNLPADSTAGIPITLSTGVNVAGANVVLTYDPALLTITGGSSPLAGVTSTIDTSIPGQVTINVTSATQFSATAGIITLANLTANVPTTAMYAAKHVLNLTVQSLTDTSAAAIPSIADDGLHVASFRGDLNGSQSINTGDATLALRLQSGVLSTTGFTALQLVDPYFAADMNDDGTASTGDITGILRFLSGASGGFPRIPALPIGLTPPPTFAADPQIFIPTAGLSGRAGDVITVPVKINVTDPNGIDLAGLSVALNYDAKKFTLTNVRLADSLVGMGASFSTATPGFARFVAVRDVGPHLTHGFVGDLFLFDLTINANATPGRFALDLLAESAATDNNAHNLLIAPTILNGPDVNDGLISIVDRNAPRHNATFAADVDADGLLTIKDILLTIFFFNQSRHGVATTPATSRSPVYVDIRPDNVIDILDVLECVASFDRAAADRSHAKTGTSSSTFEPTAGSQSFDAALLELLASDERLNRKK